MKILKDRVSTEVADARKRVYDLFRECPIPEEELLANLHLFLGPMIVNKILLLNALYQAILSVPGSIMEFGVRWGPNLAIYHALRTLYEPFNYGRRILGFDTFSGFPSVDAKDGEDEVIKTGAYDVAGNYYSYLTKLLAAREQEAPTNNIRKFELLSGDVSTTVPAYLEKHPELTIALAYFDLDIYQPTKDCLEVIKDRLTIGSILVFDELNLRQFPGETIAVQEVLGASRVRLRRSQYSMHQAYIVWGEK